MSGVEKHVYAELKNDKKLWYAVKNFRQRTVWPELAQESEDNMGEQMENTQLLLRIKWEKLTECYYTLRINWSKLNLISRYDLTCISRQV